MTPALRPSRAIYRNLSKQCYSTASTPRTSPWAPRHFLSISDLSPTELTTLIRKASSHKTSIKSGSIPKSLLNTLTGQTVAMMFNKRSTRTRISTEAAVAIMGGHAMFLGKEDIQLGVNESLHDTSVIISSMTSCMVARVGPHEEIRDLAKYSTVPVINALSNDYHPLQTLADFLTIHEAFPSSTSRSLLTPSLGLEGMKIAWVGDANNVLFDLVTASLKLGVHILVACPEGYGIPSAMRDNILTAAEGVSSPGSLTETTIPEEALKDVDVIFTDTWISMGWEKERVERLKAFQGYQITNELAKRGGAKENWRFMHCLPRHPEEVSDEVFYGPRSLVFPEGENRLWTAIAALEAIVVNKGNIEELNTL